MPESDIFDISSPFETDSKITKIEYHSYTPYTTSFNNNDEIRISIQQTDVYPYLNESFIYLEGQVSDAGKVKLTNNGFSYLFEQIRLEINGIEVDSTRVLPVRTPENYNCYENAGWIFKNSSNPANSNVEFSACIPLKYWLGLFEDFKKILRLNALKVITSGSTNSGKVVLNKIVWKVPHITVDDEERLKLLKLIVKEKTLFIPFRSFETFEYPELGTTKKVVWNLKTASKLEKPRFIIIGLQKGRKNSLEKDCSIFDHCNITNVKVFLNSIAYPYDNLNLDFTKNNFTLLYDMYISFQVSYYEKNIRNPILSPSTFLSNAPIVVIDTSKQNDSATASSVDVQLEIEASESLTEWSQTPRGFPETTWGDWLHFTAGISYTARGPYSLKLFSSSLKNGAKCPIFILLELVVKIVNSIRGKALKRRLFRELMDEVDCHYGDLLLHSNVRWISKGKVLHRFKELLPQIQIFLQKLIFFMKN
ncbi:hypothetical protein AGLY_017097 [Aphis glycines]|uniref:Double jelly roll-like domain-containing protein n=1 Tax=Aphis glycines TaxID=307491 RepID=A0A6G0SX20_APHGL|nr:hypothetical protein AGLY_017097 [Aphis glycines]